MLPTVLDRGVEIGERFGSSFDDVRRDSRPALVALAFDAAAFAALAALLALAGGGLHARFVPFAVTGALPTFSDVLYFPSTAVAAAGMPEGAWMAGVLALVLAPVAALFEGGMVGVLKAAYVDRAEGPLAPRFRDAAVGSFRPLLAYRLLLHGALVAGFVASDVFRGYHHEVVGAIVLEFLLIFTPFAVVLDGETAWGGMKRSVAAVADHLATSLVMLLFLLLVTGGAAALARELTSFFGAWVLVPVALVYAPVATALALFVMKVWTGFGPREREPVRSAPASAPAAG